MRRLILFLAMGLLVLGAVTPTTRAIAQPAAVVTDDNLEQAIANAKTPADQDAIAGLLR